ncbi:conserved Plasmodium protein, unknown function [Plasmodium malariae]|uniref:Nicalin n=1 Tax=Plasmodium malariae TaxID=5858 RepID=A0A1A8VZY3_PLAMA|nr:conserved Plasmodium protein, unknown function [Plasmodium malariae]SBS84458.1 hypothetical protein PMALA_009800 [Plasmodium malariae]SCN12168.1 conserved Plasmodium protein, unknown function [Plasmodium malariae]
MNISRRCIRIIFEILLFFCIFFKYEFARGLYETKAYPLIHLISNNEDTGFSGNLVKGNLINLLFLYKDVKWGENNLTVDSLVDMEDETHIERLIKEKIVHIMTFVNPRQLVKYSGFIYLYEIIHENNLYFLLHFILKNNNNGVIIIIPEKLHIDREEYFRINKIISKDQYNNKDITDEILEKRISFFQSLLLNLKLNQSIYFIKNNAEIENIYANYKSRFGYFDLTRNVNIIPISKNQQASKISSKNIYFFLSKDNININSIFKKKQNNETFHFTKKKTIIIATDYNVFNVISDFTIPNTSTNSQLIAMCELIRLYTEVFKNEDVNYNILFLFTNYYFGVDNFIKSVNMIFKENIEFVISLDSLNESDFYINEAKKETQPEHVLRFYDILKRTVKTNFKKDIKIKSQNIKINNKHLPKLHEYFILKNINSFTLGSKNKESVFLNKLPMIEQKLKLDNLTKHIKSIFEALFIYMKHYKEEISEEKQIKNDMLKYTNHVRSKDDLDLLNENFNKYYKFFVYRDDVLKLINYIKTLINSYIIDSNFLITDYRIPYDKKEKYFYQKHVNITFSMSISYIFHYLHFLLVALFLILIYVCVNFHFVPSFYKNRMKTM